MTVLLVEEQADVRDGLRMILEADGWTVETVPDPRDALNMLVGGFIPCIILLDLMSPVMTGMEFHREMMLHPALQRIPLVAYAGMTNVRDKAARLAADAAANPPAEIDRLLAAVRENCVA
jgi:CheY-like chemotaxis protein